MPTPTMPEAPWEQLIRGYRLWLHRQDLSDGTVHHYVSSVRALLKSTTDAWDPVQLWEGAAHLSDGRRQILRVAWKRFLDYLRLSFPGETTFPAEFPRRDPSAPPPEPRPRVLRATVEAPASQPDQSVTATPRVKGPKKPAPLPDEVLEGLWHFRQRNLGPTKLFGLRWGSLSYLDPLPDPVILVPLRRWAFGERWEEIPWGMEPHSLRPIIPLRTGSSVAYPRDELLAQFATWEAAKAQAVGQIQAVPQAPVSVNLDPLDDPERMPWE